MKTRDPLAKAIAELAGTDDVRVNHGRNKLGRHFGIWINKKYHSVDLEDLNCFMEKLRTGRIEV